MLPNRLALLDAACISVAIGAAQLLRFGFQSDDVIVTQRVQPNYWVVSVAIAVLWWLFLTAWNSREIRILGAGTEEYKRVTAASLYLFGGIAILSYAADVDTARGYVGLALPLGLALILIGRWLFRRRLAAGRRQGKFTRRIVILGGPGAVEHLCRGLMSAPEAGYVPVAAVMPGFRMEAPNGQELPVPVLSVSTNLEGILGAIEQGDADAIAISSGSALKPRLIRELGWELQARGISMIMAPALTDVAGPRIHTQPVAGLPMIHVTTPKLEGTKGVAKRTFDILSSGLAMLLLSPLLIAVAIAVKLDSPGPAFFHQDRVGKDGAPFKMHKFRSMVVDAEARLEALRAQSEGNGVLFKLKNDPRITRLGAFIRRFSIDELPQLWNVFVGEMSMVGPRPPLPGEVATYEDYVHRRLMVQPGITGLWQVSGRSDLSWDDSVRLDLYYVENWSMMQDFVILFRTAKAVVGKDGAY
ncbi:sugar transferase [Arthrobacter halodurans]|uniref:Sugar transferase n=1 Tax=Arthrobacter halodurans TaxID=516699 RepID=A0ABV4UMM6_9MICC